MITMKQSYEIEYDGTHNVCRMDIYADTAADLTGLDNLDGVYFLAGSEAYDIATGDKYMMNSSGTWILQPSNNAWQNVYTKTQIDTMLTDYYTATQIDTTLLQYYTISEVDEKLTHKAALSFTPGGTIGNLLNCTFTIPDSTRTLRFTVGKLNATQNYLQIYVNGVDKGYIIFDISRNIDNWGE